MDAIKAIVTRRSVRKFTAGAVGRKDLETLVDAGRLAASARNVQPCRFVVVTERQTLDDLSRLIDTARFFSSAPAGIAVFSEDTKYFIEDGSAATQNILVAATALGLGTCWIAGDKKPFAGEVARMFGAPEGLRLVSLVVVGYAAEIPQPPKKALAEVLFWEKF